MVIIDKDLLPRLFSLKRIIIINFSLFAVTNCDFCVVVIIIIIKRL